MRLIDNLKENNMSNITIMPFGKYKGKPIVDIPSNYLLWAAENLVQEDICQACDKEWQFREKYNAHFKEGE